MHSRPSAAPSQNPADSSSTSGRRNCEARLPAGDEAAGGGAGLMARERYAMGEGYASAMPADTTWSEPQLLIGGKWVDASDGTYDIVNPATEEVVGQAPNASVADADAAAAAAREALPAWSRLPVEERCELMRRAAA